MLLVIGPTCAGKSTYIQALRTEAVAKGQDLDVHFAFTALEADLEVLALPVVPYVDARLADPRALLDLETRADPGEPTLENLG